MPSNDACQPCCVTGLGEGLGAALDGTALGDALDAVALGETLAAGTAGEAAGDEAAFVSVSACARVVESTVIIMTMAQAAMNGGLTVDSLT